MAKGKKKLTTAGLRKTGGYQGQRYKSKRVTAGKRGGKHKASAGTIKLLGFKIWG
jgi:hypothetical protein